MSDLKTASQAKLPTFNKCYESDTWPAKMPRERERESEREREREREREGNV